MHSEGQHNHPNATFLGDDHESITKSHAANRRVFLYPTLSRGGSNTVANNNRHEQVQFFQTQPPIDFNDRCSLLPPNKPPQNLSFSKIHMGPPPKDPLPLPPIIHRITSSPLPSSRYECIGDPSLRIFKLLLPRDLVGRLDGIVAHSERFAEGLAGGWKTELYSLTRQDLALRDIPGMTARIRPIFDYITQAIKALYGCRKVIVDKNQPHILKYSMDTEHTGVQLHHDRCDVTANLVLSRSNEYEGGGTYIPDAGGRIIRLEQGEFLLHPGSLVHGGVDIHRGTRYLMVLFAHLK